MQASNDDDANFHVCLFPDHSCARAIFLFASPPALASLADASKSETRSARGQCTILTSSRSTLFINKNKTCVQVWPIVSNIFRSWGRSVICRPSTNWRKNIDTLNDRLCTGVHNLLTTHSRALIHSPTHPFTTSCPLSRPIDTSSTLHASRTHSLADQVVEFSAHRLPANVSYSHAWSTSGKPH